MKLQIVSLCAFKIKKYYLTKKYDKIALRNYEFFGNRCIFAPEKEIKTITITS